MIRTVLVFLAVCALCFAAGMMWERHPEWHPQVFRWISARSEPKCPAGFSCRKL